MSDSLFPPTHEHFTCPKCSSLTSMIQLIPIWVCPVCRSAFSPELASPVHANDRADSRQGFAK